MLVFITGCATERHQVINSFPTPNSQKNVNSNKVKVSIGRFNNHSAYQNGVFANGEDRLGTQAQTILVTSLQQSGKFSVMDRENMLAAKQESEFSKKARQIKGADYIIAGDIVEFGRKTVGDHQLFGIIGRGKTQKSI